MHNGAEHINGCRTGSKCLLFLPVDYVMDLLRLAQDGSILAIMDVTLLIHIFDICLLSYNRCLCLSITDKCLIEYDNNVVLYLFGKCWKKAVGEEKNKIAFQNHLILKTSR